VISLADMLTIMPTCNKPVNKAEMLCCKKQNPPVCGGLFL